MLLFFVLKNKCSQIKLSNRCWRTRTLWMQISRFLSISLQLPMWGRDSCFSSHILCEQQGSQFPHSPKQKKMANFLNNLLWHAAITISTNNDQFYSSLHLKRTIETAVPLKKKLLKIKNWAGHCIRRWFMLTMPPADLLLARRVCEVLCL